MVSVGLLIGLTLVLKWLWCEHDAKGHANAAKTAISAGGIGHCGADPGPHQRPEEEAEGPPHQGPASSARSWATVRAYSASFISASAVRTARSAALKAIRSFGSMPAPIFSAVAISSPRASRWS